MKKVRAQTLQQRFGFMDNELSTPDHDSIIIWLDENINDITEGIISWRTDWKPNEVERLRMQAQTIVDSTIEHYKESRHDFSAFEQWEGLGMVVSKPPLQIENIIWEYAIKSKTYIIGFIDIVVEISYPILIIDYDSVYDFYGAKRNIAENIPTWGIRNQHRTLNFEVKTKIPSVGELLRQIRMYQEYAKGKFYVVCPDDKFALHLKSQGVGFVKYPSGEIL